ncbi:MAG: menaquinone biosynthesis protein [Candidatus Methylacidiphilales bacterium]
MSSLHSRRIGCVPFLNARPLIAAFPRAPILEEPAQLARSLAEGRLDLALVPSFAALHGGWSAVAGYGIACLGEVRSVILIRNKPREFVKTVALDAGSQTSANLLQILFRRHWKQPVTYVPQEAPADARLWIGDRALHHRRGVDPDQIDDLGAAWWEWTGLPFVFALWAVRPGLQLPIEEADQLRAWCQSSLALRSHLATNQEERDYLTEAIRYPIGEPERQALDRFGAELTAAGLASQGRLGPWF